jgi:hypothetical protein
VTASLRAVSEATGYVGKAVDCSSIMFKGASMPFGQFSRNKKLLRMKYAAYQNSALGLVPLTTCAWSTSAMA